MRPLPTRQRITARLIWRSTRRTIVRMSWVRTCCGTGQILLLARGLPVGVAVVCRRKRLPIGAIHGRGLADATPDCMRRNECLGLGGNGGEDAVLVEPHAVGATTVFCRLEAGAPNLRLSQLAVSLSLVVALARAIAMAMTHLPTSTVAAGNGSALAGSWRLVVVLLHILGRRRRLLAIWIWRRRRAGPLVGAGQTIWLLVLILRMLGHVGSGLLRRRRRERGVHMRGRLRIRAIWGLLRGGRLPVRGNLALAALVREHGRGGGK
jgi:hypothetical protein